MTVQTHTAITDVRTVGVPVTDQDRALAFYVEKLGFEKRLDAPVEQFGGPWVEVAPPPPPRRSRSSPRTGAHRPASRTGIRLTTRTRPPPTQTCRSAAITPEAALPTRPAGSDRHVWRSSEAMPPRCRSGCPNRR
jgi:catechol 2,3-dioxygenase-like lactoylglutathione lyase family enzyme